MSEKLTFEALKNRKKPAVKDIEICLDPEMADKFTEAKKRLEVAKKGVEIAPASLKDQRSKELKVVAKAYDKAKEDFEESVVTFRFRSIGRKRVDDLVSAHPPTEQNIKDAEKEGIEIAFNPLTFPPALIAACCVDPELTEEDVLEIWDSDDWSQTDLQMLYSTAMSVNQMFVDVSSLKKD